AIAAASPRAEPGFHIGRAENDRNRPRSRRSGLFYLAYPAYLVDLATHNSWYRRERSLRVWVNVRNSVPRDEPCQAPEGEFFRSLQTASDCLHGRFRESGAASLSLAGFVHLS